PDLQVDAASGPVEVLDHVGRELRHVVGGVATGDAVLTSADGAAGQQQIHQLLARLDVGQLPVGLDAIERGLHHRLVTAPERGGLVRVERAIDEDREVHRPGADVDTDGEI